jgi:hypothetical protein
MSEEEKKNKPGIPEFGKVEDGHIVLPFKEGQFERFIKGLLGSPQTISNTKKGSYEIDVNDLRSLYQLISQRITQQNDGKLIDFNSKIVFDDDSTVTLNSLQELLTYNEVRPIVSEAIHLEWKFLVKFQDKEFPERQNIKVSFLSSDAGNRILDDGPILIVNSSNQGRINYRVEHTARTWGADIEAMLTNHFDSLLQSTSKVKDFIRKNKNSISFGVASLFFLCSLAVSFWTTNNFSNNRVDYVNEQLSSITGTDIDAITTKINSLAEVLSSGAWAQHFFAVFVFIIFSFIAAIFLGIWVDSAADNPEPSFILLTKKSKEHKKNVLKKKKKKWLSFTFSLITGVAVGVISNLIFNALFSV